ncbi:VOC family protein [Nocardia cyriacigeorgica]|uniref:VOC family protein n=1 Tax=Nocardia cyriacigeorgica TaxID=135487 RepID=UPI0013D0C444|nr:VOC family protein [Nocardia cyriacigeorgica]MBF6436808.1 VOC family protein [Nocardia cyriacigeorgica]MBF6452378.1 VOC family protein [Nocardia cyriacigeorgica]MBF6481108.1 VOC family protein [Nocardia cyriacigeorgica]MBF6549547.1 VOC family protein [Nocardia cyriacigeorgica]NEW29133.1 glyoxalase [Nocardia cyriacigeorgica]
MTTPTSTTTHVWPCLAFRDARATAKFLTDAFGFELTALYAREDDPSVVEHAEMRWPAGGGIMFGSIGRNDSEFGQRPAGAASLYLVCDDPDALYERATKAGARIVRELRDEDYGSRGFSAADPEGNLWSFGTYAGE